MVVTYYIKLFQTEADRQRYFNVSSPSSGRGNYVIFGTKILNMQIIYFQFQGFHMLFMTPQSTNFFAEVMKGSSIFCCLGRVSVNPPLALQVTSVNS